jgi:Rrf2 family nitric oxide-sensitive transcriptional repressor
MRLTRQTDYSLRILIYLAAHEEQEWVSAATIASAYDISSHHLSKIAKELVSIGYLRSRRGVSGGVQLAHEPSSLRIGALIQALEPSLELLECFNSETNQCCLSPACGLKRALYEAQRAFFEVLDSYTLEDIVHNRSLLVALLSRSHLTALSGP